MAFPGRQGGPPAGGRAVGRTPAPPGPVDGGVRFSEQPVPTCVAKAHDWIFKIFKAVYTLRDPHLSHLGLEYNCIGLINSFSFRSKVEAGTQRCKSNTNPLWAPILRTIKTKSSAAAAAPHKTLGKHAQRAANQPASLGAQLPLKMCGQGGGPTPAGGQVEVGRGQNLSSRAESWAAAWRNSRGHTHSPGAQREWRPRQKSNRAKPIAPARTRLRAPQKERAGLGECWREEKNEKRREKKRKWGKKKMGLGRER